MMVRVGRLVVGAVVVAAASAVGCDAMVESTVQCRYRGEVYDAGASFSDGCNTCSCNDDGSVSCTLMACADCSYEGNLYAVGESFPAGDGCNLCTCSAPGEVSCTAAGCVTTCQYAGKTYSLGETFPATDGCNHCECMSDGSVGCSEKGCSCDPQSEWWRQYAATSAEECAVIDFDCPANTGPFENECGCGCEQSLECPKVLECDPGECEEPQKECPFSSSPE